MQLFLLICMVQAFNVEFDKLLSVQRNYCLADMKLSREIRERIKKAVCESYADFYARFFLSVFDICCLLSLRCIAKVSIKK